jgi:hypothetical protein
MAYTAGWFIGSRTIAAQSFQINGNAVSVPAGTYYLTDPSAALSLLSEVASAMSAGLLFLPTAVLLGSGKVRLTAAGAFTVTWGTATALRDLLGFTGDLGSATSHTATLKSPLWWSPGKPALFALTPLGVTGQPRYILSQSISAYSGRAESTSHGERSYQRFTFEKVDAERMSTPASLGGEYGVWFAAVAARSARFKMYRDAVEDASSASAFTYDTVHGPYVLPLGGSAEWAYQRSAGFTWTDMACDITVAATVCPEIDP